MSNPWFRLYSEFAHDPKVQMMSEAMQRRYVMLMCMRCSNVTASLRNEEIAFQLRISDAELIETKAFFIEKGFIDDAWNLVNWDKRQFASDRDSSGAKRQKEFRERQREKKSVTLRNAPITLPDTDTDTDTDKKKEDKSSSAPNAKQVRFDAASGVFEVPEQFRLQWVKAYPAIEIDTELSQAASWLLANPKNAKSNYARFLVNWLSKAQDTAPVAQRQKVANKSEPDWNSKPAWAVKAGFEDLAAANLARCYERNAHEFSNGKRTEVAL